MDTTLGTHDYKSGIGISLIYDLVFRYLSIFLNTLILVLGTPPTMPPSLLLSQTYKFLTRASAAKNLKCFESQQIFC